MSFLDCINNGEKEGNLTAEQAEKARRLYASFEAENRGLMAGEEAAAKASQETFDALEKEAKERVRRTALQRKAQRRVRSHACQHHGSHPPARQGHHHM